MATTYKVWLHIEKHNDRQDLYEDQGLPHQLAVFGTLAAAERFVSELVDGNIAPDKTCTN